MSEKTIVEADPKPSWIAPSWCSWNKFSESMLRTIEKKIFAYMKTAYRGWYVDIGPVVGPADKMWTISMNAESKNTPLVMLHGLGAGVALWCLNLDALSATRPVYAVDLLGFGRSSRPLFSRDAAEAEQQFVKAVEEWRREMNLDKFIILGHSMGGFLAAAYALTYPERVKHLILADPWGFPEKPPESQRKAIPLWVRAVAYTLSPFNPLAAVRAAGPWGQWIIDKARPDKVKLGNWNHGVPVTQLYLIAKKFSNALEDEGLITQYIYQCNSQTPSGESAFHCMMSGFGWAKHPMVSRIHELDKNIPITLMYGSRSWVDNSAGEIIKEKRMESYVKLQVISGAGHHVYADKPDVFNKYVVEACNYADGIVISKYPAIMPANTDNTESDMELDEGTDKPKSSPISSPEA